MAGEEDKVRRGDPVLPRAAFWNEMVDVVQEVQSGSVEDRQNRLQTIDYVPVEVALSANHLPGDVIGFSDGPVRLATDAASSLRGVIFNEASPANGRWLLLPEGGRNGRVAKAMIVGVGWTQANIADGAHTHVEHDGTGLKSATGGYGRILYKPSGTGTHWVLVQLGGCTSADTGNGTGTNNGTGDQCICNLIDALEAEGSLSAATAGTLRTTCNCVATVECDGIIFPETIVGTFSDFTDVTHVDGFNVPNAVTRRWSQLNGRTMTWTNLAPSGAPTTQCIYSTPMAVSYDTEIGGATRNSTITPGALAYTIASREWAIFLQHNGTGQATDPLGGTNDFINETDTEVAGSPPDLSNPVILRVFTPSIAGLYYQNGIVTLRAG